jgi:hypothetical protein
MFVCDFCHRLYIGTNFLTNQPEQRGSPVRRWQITECAQPLPGRHMAREKCFHVIVSLARSVVLFIIFLSLARSPRAVAPEKEREGRSHEKKDR